jgi:hypothetical protein
MRKNLRGFHRHVQALVDRQIREEFPELGFVCVSPGVLGDARDAVVAHWYEVKIDGRPLRYIMLNTYAARGRGELLGANDEELKDLVRHELLHGELKRRDMAYGDNDLPFIMECLRRHISVNESSIQAFEAVHGRGSFELFRYLLPPAETELIALADGGGVWVREKAMKG